MLSSLQRLLLAFIRLAVVVDAQAVAGKALDIRQNDLSLSDSAAPVVFTPDQNWDGIDGRWSSFTLRVGTPEQFVRVFASWAGYQTWVIIPEGCQAAADYDDCKDERGWIFNETESSTWDERGTFALGIEQNLGLDSNARFGFDDVGLGGAGEGGPKLENTTIGGVATDKYWLGLFGLHPKPTNFTDFNEGVPSYMTLLKEQGVIPSMSFGFTAGAHYMYSVGEYASLTLGGFDSSKFVENDVEWTFAPDNERDTVVAIQQITTPSTIESNPEAVLLLPDPIYAYIDATVAEIWLPETACEAFESEFGIEYDEELDLYAINDTLHDDLKERNANVTFTLAEELDGGDKVEITLPYAAFDHSARPPYASVTNTTNYFPLRRAANDTQYTLGRTFMQEAYITVNWETFRFNVSQVDWNRNAGQNVVTIPSMQSARVAAEQTEDFEQDSGGISAGAIAGIVVGVVVALAVIGLAVFFFLRRKRRRSSGEQLDEKTAPPLDTDAQSQGNVVPKAELQGSEAFHPPVSYYDQDIKAWVTSPAGSSAPGTPSSSYPNSNSRGFFPGSTVAGSPTTPTAGEGTHSSSQTGYSNPFATPVSEADSKAIHVFEMPGDMPSIREKDGKQLSEKEALQHREALYNGVDSTPPESAVEEVSRDLPPRRVDPEHVVRAEGGTLDGSTIAGSPVTAGEGTSSTTRQHRAFSFEDDGSGRATYTNSTQ
ncbi:hypothetical protein MBLNU230_g4060t1 [Neophaeotheca triangularis]